MCVCDRETERERQSERDREGNPQEKQKRVIGSMKNEQWVNEHWINLKSIMLFVLKLKYQITVLNGIKRYIKTINGCFYFVSVHTEGFGGKIYVYA